MISPQPEPLIICDASPLILLAKISKAELLLQLAKEIWIPDVVWEEITRKSGQQAEIPVLMTLFSHCVRSVDMALKNAFQTLVDAGEAAALALASQRPEALLLMDDRRGRLLAANQGLRCIGTLGLLVRAKRSGLITAIKPLLSDLKTQGLFVAPQIEQDVLCAAGEI